MWVLNYCCLLRFTFEAKKHGNAIAIWLTIYIAYNSEEMGQIENIYHETEPTIFISFKYAHLTDMKSSNLRTQLIMFIRQLNDIIKWQLLAERE